jgi:hypothetical protein
MTTSSAPCVVLHRALVNAGDFLIRDRTLQLLQAHRPDLQITLGKAWLPLRSQFDSSVLDRARAVVVCGGPGYQRGMYPDVYPLAPVETLRAPIFLTALGSYAMRDPSAGSDELDNASVQFLHNVQERGGRLGARDDLTGRMLEHIGIQDVTMTGDPAWYDLDWLHRDGFADRSSTVLFTPPANPLFHRQGERLLHALVDEYGARSVTVVFHRHRQKTFLRVCEALGLQSLEISGGAEGFEHFDRAGLHVGYRVHAHLYCVSHETPSYLIAEDSRGLGMLETLGPLGIDGLGSRASSIAERLWRNLPRLGSDRLELTRRLGLRIAAIARLPDVGALLLAQIGDDRAGGYARHVEAKATIRATYPRIIDMLKSIP